jgi:hypothetical protein
VSSKRGNLRSPNTFIGAVQIAIDNVKLLARGTAGKGGLDRRTFMDDQRVGGDCIRGVGGGIGIGSSGVGMDDSNYTAPRGVGGREMDGVRSENLTQRVEVPIRGSTNILEADDTIAFKKGLDVTEDLEEARGDTTWKGEAAGVDIVGYD